MSVAEKIDYLHSKYYGRQDEMCDVMPAFKFKTEFVEEMAHKFILSSGAYKKAFIPYTPTYEDGKLITCGITNIRIKIADDDVKHVETIELMEYHNKRVISRVYPYATNNLTLFDNDSIIPITSDEGIHILFKSRSETKDIVVLLSYDIYEITNMPTDLDITLRIPQTIIEYVPESSLKSAYCKLKINANHPVYSILFSFMNNEVNIDKDKSYLEFNDIQLFLTNICRKIDKQHCLIDFNNTINFSRIDNIVLHLYLEPQVCLTGDDIEAHTYSQVAIECITRQLVRIKGRQIGLYFSK